MNAATFSLTNRTSRLALHPSAHVGTARLMRPDSNAVPLHHGPEQVPKLSMIGTTTENGGDHTFEHGAELLRKAISAVFELEVGQTPRRLRVARL